MGHETRVKHLRKLIEGLPDEAVVLVGDDPDDYRRVIEVALEEGDGGWDTLAHLSPAPDWRNEEVVMWRKDGKFL